MKRFFVYIFFLSCLFLFHDSLVCSVDLKTRIEAGEYPEWMKEEIDNNLKYFRNRPISLSSLNSVYEDRQELFFVKFTIFNNEVNIEDNLPSRMAGMRFRATNIQKALRELSKITSLPNTVFLLCILDGLDGEDPAVPCMGDPIFVMSKTINSEQLILIPDFDAVIGGYQVVKNFDITKNKIPWKSKKKQLVWRGSTGQSTPEARWYCADNNIKKDNLHLFSRIKLCELSKRSNLINAGFTSFTQGAKEIPYLKTLKKKFIPYMNQLKFRYHILIDGNTTSYSASGWRFLTNSLLFMPDSNWIQWYHCQLKPDVHYVPVKANLEDLIQKINWAIDNDEQAEQIADNCHRFACEYITIDENLLYLYHLLNEYSQLQFVD